jgi:hypothetical protein
MQIKISDLSLDLNMSTLAGLSDLVEDEVIPEPLPMQVNLLCWLVFTVLLNSVLFSDSYINASRTPHQKILVKRTNKRKN